ncbi:unnamed protein product [Arabis nemorensis]|uniref:Neprosin PEP catalytic domain-containing protein n=1 Tax=Arabis nemorensis TaxID=586526 RepID=A0A565BLE3_9BRAS|nr:unnamed protein product [Arabis nemorensis]
MALLHLAIGLCVYLLFTHGAEGNIDDFDCVDIYKQPAFQHPLLKNHKIQKTFSSHENLERSNEDETKEQCPEGMVPILRQRNESESFHLNTAENFGQHFATIETMLDGSIYRGAEAEISIHNLNLRNNQYSKSQMWFENGPPGQLNSIQAGWAVHPRLYGDSVTRFTIYWTGDGYHKTGCYNTQCPGFVVTSRNPRIGNQFWGTSIYGKSSVLFRTQVVQDGFSGNWGLKIFDEVIDGISPPMGNGHFPVADFKKTAHFRNVVIINSDYKKLLQGDILELYHIHWRSLFIWRTRWKLW